LPSYDIADDAIVGARHPGDRRHMVERRLAYQRSGYDQAAELQHKQLAASRQLGDLEEIAVPAGALVAIDLARQDYQAAPSQTDRILSTWVPQLM
jgi:hypothetical protein